MENSINLEFYGLPGSGKTGISHLVATELRKQGLNVYEPSYLLDNTNIKLFRRIKKMILLLKLHICYSNDYRQLERIVVNNGYNGIDKIKQLSNVAYKYLFYKKEKKGYIYIWDEGLFQSSISLSTFNQKIVDNFNSIISLLDKKVVGVYIKANIEDAIKRVSMRKKHESRVEKLNNMDDIIVMMNNIEKCCDAIYDKNHILSTDIKIEDAVINILKQLDVK